MTNILYSFRRCPYAMRARMALKYSSIGVKIFEVSLKNKPQSMLDVSPKGQVPVLVKKSGDVVDESREIITFALSVNDPDGWLDVGKSVLKEAEKLIQINDGCFKANLDEYKYFTKNEALSLEKCRVKGEGFLIVLEKKLSVNKYLFSNKISYADISIFPFIRQFAHVDKEWFFTSKYVQLQKWLNVFLESDLFNSIMVKDLKEI